MFENDTMDYLSILEHFNNRPFCHRACFIRTKTGSIFDTLIYVIFLCNKTKKPNQMMHEMNETILHTLTFKASRFVLAFICGIQNRRELNAALSKLNRFL